MDKATKNKLTRIGNSQYFKEVIEKLTLDQELLYGQKTFILSSAILFLKEYEKDKKKISYADFAYYIFLKYSLRYNDFSPLYEFSTNFGFYPISKIILENNLVEHLSLEDYVIQKRIEDYKHEKGYIETLNQFKSRNSFIKDNEHEKSYIAPTSFGKSSIIVDYIKDLDNYHEQKIVVVVPTKSLLMQTYRMIQKSQLSLKTIIHEGMYQNENAFIAIFTQERALRLIEKGCFFDVLIIDEAHKIFEKDRGILITRLIQKNYNLNSKHKTIYLSPLVRNVENLKLSSDQYISNHSIGFNLKEPEFFEYRELSGVIYQYNRFVNQSYKIGNASSAFSYIEQNSKNKNFLFENSPQKIELLARNFCNSGIIQKIELSDEILELKNILKEKVHKDYYAIKYLDYGVIYIHGQLPDLVKEYLEYKFKNIETIKYIIANTVILEGMNLPIDTLFILGARQISNGKSLLNLVGRVNRLDRIFARYEKEDLPKLLPKIHIINSNNQDKIDSKFRYLRSRIFDDVIKNPILKEYDINKVVPPKSNTGYRERFIHRITQIKEQEKFIYTKDITQKDSIKKYFIENGINSYYEDIDKAISHFVSRKESSGTNPKFNDFSLMEKISYIFITDTENIYDYEFKRVAYEATQKYYEGYFLTSKKQNLNSNIEWQVKRFNEIIDNPTRKQKKVYIGPSYGDTTWNSSNWGDSKKEVYINLEGKEHTALINIAIVKLQIEENFVSFTLNKFIETLFNFDIISEDEYNFYVYGTKDKEKIDLHKQGLSLNLITRLKEDDQLKNILTDEFNNLVGNQEFKEFMYSIDDFYRFEIKRFIFIED